MHPDHTLCTNCLERLEITLENWELIQECKIPNYSVYITVCPFCGGIFGVDERGQEYCLDDELILSFDTLLSLASMKIVAAALQLSSKKHPYEN